SEVRETGLEPVFEEFSLSRVDIADASLAVNGRRIEGLPFFDGGFTDVEGIAGSLGDLGSDASIGLTEIPPNASEAGALGDSRRPRKHGFTLAPILARRRGLPISCRRRRTRWSRRWPQR